MIPVSATLAFNPLWSICDFPAATWAQPVFVINLLYLRSHLYFLFLVLEQTRTLSAIKLPKLQRGTRPLLNHQLVHTMKHYTWNILWWPPFSKSFSWLLFEFQEETPGCTASVKQFQLPLSGERWCTNFSHHEILWFHPDLEGCFHLFLCSF